MKREVRFVRHWTAGLLLVTALGVAMLFATRPVAGDQDDHSVIVRGAGTTIVQGGTGPSGGFVPVLTTLAFHAERSAGGVTGRTYTSTRTMSLATNMIPKATSTLPAASARARSR